MIQKSISRKLIILLAAFVLVVGFTSIYACFGAKAFADEEQASLSAGPYTVEVDCTYKAPTSANEGVFVYDGGTMIITGAGFSGSNTSTSVAEGTQITITLAPNQGYQIGRLMDAGQDVALSEGVFSTQVQKNYAFEPEFITDSPEPGPSVKDGDVQIAVSQTQFANSAPMYKIGDGEWQEIGAGKTLTPTDMGANTSISIKGAPASGKAFDMEATRIVIGKDEQQVNKDALASSDGVTVSYDPAKGHYLGIGFMETRDVTLQVGEASKAMLASKLTMIVGYGDRNDVTFTENGTVTVAKNTQEKTLLSFAINNSKYFIPTVKVNGVSYETFDTGMKTSEGNIIIGVKLEGTAAQATTFNVDLTVGAVAMVANQTASVSEAEAKYSIINDGISAFKGTEPMLVSLSVKDTALDSSVDGAVATFDLGLEIDGTQAATIDTPLQVSMKLDKTVYSADTYQVVRNHQGTLTTLDAEYDAEEGIVTFESDQYSDYSLVAKSSSDNKTSDTSSSSTEKSSTAKTGDSGMAAVIAFTVIASGAVVVALRRREMK